MTNPVNAGADIEKELAEKYGIDFSDIRRTYIGSNVHAVAAALLAEAGERKRLEAERDDYRVQANCMGVRTPYKCAAPEEVGHTIYGAFFKVSDTEYWCEFHWFKKQIAAAELRASTEAERARGLEAQLETVKEDITSLIGNASQYTSAAWIVDALDKILAALSQLPTPAQEKK